MKPNYRSTLATRARRVVGILPIEALRQLCIKHDLYPKLLTDYYCKVELCRVLTDSNSKDAAKLRLSILETIDEMLHP